MAKSLQYANEHGDEVRAVLTTYTKIDAKVQPALVLPKWTDQINKDSLNKLTDLAKKDGFLTGNPDISALAG
jgi:NitT/TauT family transport system substrate-binding protein